MFATGCSTGHSVTHHSTDSRRILNSVRQLLPLIQTAEGRSAFANGSRKSRVWRRLCLRSSARGLYMLSFEGCEDRFTSEIFDRVFSEYKLFSYVNSWPAARSNAVWLTRNSIPPTLSSFPCSTKFTNWRNPMRQSASRIRSLANRYASAEAAAFLASAGARSLSRTTGGPLPNPHSFPRFAHHV